jgi:protein-tyrosine phosphatase
MNPSRAIAALAASLLLASAAPAFARADQVAVARVAPDRVTVSWTGKGPVDLFWADHAVTDPAAAKLVSAGDRDGKQDVTVDPAARPYFLVRDRADGSLVEVAERLVPLDQGSKFRAIGGYQAAGGKHLPRGSI